MVYIYVFSAFEFPYTGLGDQVQYSGEPEAVRLREMRREKLVDFGMCLFYRMMN